MRALFTLVIIGTLAGLTECQLCAAEPPDTPNVPWAAALTNRATATVPDSGAVVVSQSVARVPVNPEGAPCEPMVVADEVEKHYQAVWGEVDFRLYPDAGRMAPNGVAYNPLFSLDVDTNIWLWRSRGVYLYIASRFWGGRGGEADQTQGNIDYTRREFDMNSGVAWNYYGQFELRAVGYDRENFNRGTSMIGPDGHTNDGSGVEQRYYLNEEYARLGQDGFNVSRATFVSLGYYPTKSLIGGDGIQYRPGLFAHAYLIWDIPTTPSYWFLDLEQNFTRSGFTPRMLYSDVGVAIVPFDSIPLLEFRLGSEFNTDFNASGSVRNMSLPYVQIRLNY